MESQSVADAPSDPAFTAAFTEDASAYLRAHAGMQLIDDGGNRSILLREFAVTGNLQWGTSRGSTALEQLRAIRRQRPSGSVVLTDTTAMLSAVAITAAPDARSPTSLSLLDLASLLNAAVFHDRVLFLGPVPTLWCDDLGGYLNGLLSENVFVAVGDPDTVAANAEGLALRELFDEAAGHLKRIFKPDSRLAPNVSELELNEVVATWAKVLRRPPGSLLPSELYDGNVASSEWRSSSSGYGAWLIRRLGSDEGAYGATVDLEAFIRFLGPRRFAEVATEVHLRALFNSVLAYNVLECPYRATIVRQPWSSLFAHRADAVGKSLLIEGLVEEVVRRRRMQFQRPSTAVLSLPSVLSLALRNAKSPADVWRIAGQLRVEMAPFRRRQAKLIQVLTEGEGKDDQSYARSLLQALQDGVPTTLSDKVATTTTVTVSVLPKLLAAPTGAGLVDLLATVNSAANSSGAVGRLVRWLLQPELHAISKLSADAGASLGAMRHIKSLWNLGDPAVATLEVSLQNLAS
jgi:hypothetical protein